MSPLDILFNITLPIFVLVGVGVIFDKAFDVDLRTLTRLLFYVFSPAIVFSTLVESSLSLSELASIGLYEVLHALVMFAVGFGLFSVKPFRDRRTILTMGGVFTNSGNYGFPLMLLAFGDYGLSVVAVVLITQAILLNSFGLLFLLGDSSTVKQSVKEMLKIPVTYALILGLIVRGIGLELPTLISVPLEHFTTGFIALALVTLGVQLNRSEIVGDILPMTGIVGVRLMISPLVSAGLTLLLGFPADLTAVLIVAGGLPAAVNVFILANEFKRNPSFASRMVFWTTLLTAISLPVLLLIVRVGA